MWIGDKIYFLSDRNGRDDAVSLRPEEQGRRRELIENTGKDIEFCQRGAGRHRLRTVRADSSSTISRRNRARRCRSRSPADLTEVRPHFQNVAREMRNARISPTGVRAVFEAHGEILTVPAEKGDIRNLTNTPGVMERTPAWSPDGKSIAYFSDESGEYALHIKPQNGEGETKKIPLDGQIGVLFRPELVARQQAHRVQRQ